MNTEAPQDQIVPQTTGSRLRQAREKLGLSQQTVAVRLCLKVSTVSDIEENTLSPDLAETFLRGYIRSYAKLVQIPDDELATLLGEPTPEHGAKVTPLQSMSLNKSHKKRDGWLMVFTWLVAFVVLGLTGAWWWQNHKAQQQDIVNMADQSSAQLARNNGQPIALDNGNDASSPATTGSPATASPATKPSVTSTAASPSTTTTSTTTPTTSTSTAQTSTAVATQNQAANATGAQSSANAAGTSSAPTSSLPTNNAEAATDQKSAALVMNFTGDCWVQVDDATGKTLVNSKQKKGSTLSITGVAPYKLKIGIPGAVQVQYQGKPVDLSSFIKSRRVARLTLAAE